MQEKASAKLEAILFGRRAGRFGNAVGESRFLFEVLYMNLVYNIYVIKNMFKKSIDSSKEQE
jgi:hypothetical protein